MAKKEQHLGVPAIVTAQPDGGIEHTAETAEDVVVPLRRVAEKHQQCPLCYNGEMNGVGQSNGLYEKASTLTRRYYRCDRCGHSWSVDLRPEEVVRINYQDPGPLSAR